MHARVFIIIRHHRLFGLRTINNYLPEIKKKCIKEKKMQKCEGTWKVYMVLIGGGRGDGKLLIKIFVLKYNMYRYLFSFMYILQWYILKDPKQRYIVKSSKGGFFFTSVLRL